MSNKKKKLTPRELAKKQERREAKEKQRKRGRLYSMVAVTIGCVGSSFFWPRENTTAFIALCVVTGVLWGLAFDFIYSFYMKKKGK